MIAATYGKIIYTFLVSTPVKVSKSWGSRVYGHTISNQIDPSGSVFIFSKGLTRLKTFESPSNKWFAKSGMSWPLLHLGARGI